MHKRSDSQQPAAVRRFSVTSKLITLFTVISVCSGLLLFDQLSRNLRQLNQLQLDTLGNSIAAQLALNSGPLILGRDWVSLNISLKQLTDDPQIQGAEIKSSKGEMIAQAGQPIGQKYEQNIESGNTSLGQLLLYLSEQPAQSASNTVIHNLGLVLIACFGLSLVIVWLFSRHIASPIKDLELAATQIQEGLEINHLDDTRTDEFGKINHMLNQQFAYDQEFEENEVDAIEELESDDKPKLDSINTEQSSLMENNNSTTTGNSFAEQQQDPPLETHTEISVEEFEALSPRLESISPALKPLFAKQQPNDIELTQAQPLPPVHTDYCTKDVITSLENNIDKKQTSAKELYYLLYINQKDSSSNALEPEERDNLLQVYRQIFEQACVLYKGSIYQDDQENWFALFKSNEDVNSSKSQGTSDRGDTENLMNHGISSLCAAQLFKGLYQGLNQHRIHQFKPVLNLKMSLVCGDGEKEQMIAQAQQLSLSVETNELIADHQLYAVEPIKTRMLASGKYKKANDNTYLISSLSNDFQDLIDRQVEHFLHPQQENPLR